MREIPHLLLSNFSMLWLTVISRSLVTWLQQNPSKLTTSLKWQCSSVTHMILLWTKSIGHQKHFKAIIVTRAMYSALVSSCINSLHFVIHLPRWSLNPKRSNMTKFTLMRPWPKNAEISFLELFASKLTVEWQPCNHCTMSGLRKMLTLHLLTRNCSDNANTIWENFALLIWFKKLPYSTSSKNFRRTKSIF